MFVLIRAPIHNSACVSARDTGQRRQFALRRDVYVYQGVPAAIPSFSHSFRGRLRLVRRFLCRFAKFSPRILQRRLCAFGGPWLLRREFFLRARVGLRNRDSSCNPPWLSPRTWQIPRKLRDGSYLPSQSERDETSSNARQCEKIYPSAGNKWALIWMHIAPKQGLSK